MSTSPPVVKGIEIGRATKDELVDLISNPHRVWNEISSSEDGVKLWKTLDLETNMEICKAEAIIDTPAAVSSFSHFFFFTNRVLLIRCMFFPNL